MHSNKKIPVFVYCPKFLREKIARLKQLELSNPPIFFSEDRALTYSRFMGEEHGILKMYVHESSIVGSHDRLTLRDKAIDTHCIHGCFASEGKQREYFHNPAFNPVYS